MLKYDDLFNFLAPYIAEKENTTTSDVMSRKYQYSCIRTYIANNDESVSVSILNCDTGIIYTYIWDSINETSHYIPQLGQNALGADNEAFINYSALELISDSYHGDTIQTEPEPALL